MHWLCGRPIPQVPHGRTLWAAGPPQAQQTTGMGQQMFRLRCGGGPPACSAPGGAAPFYLPVPGQIGSAVAGVGLFDQCALLRQDDPGDVDEECGSSHYMKESGVYDRVERCLEPCEESVRRKGKKQVSRRCPAPQAQAGPTVPAPPTAGAGLFSGLRKMLSSARSRVAGGGPAPASDACAAPPPPPTPLCALPGAGAPPVPGAPACSGAAVLQRLNLLRGVDGSWAMEDSTLLLLLQGAGRAGGEGAAAAAEVAALRGAKPADVGPLGEEEWCTLLVLAYLR